MTGPQTPKPTGKDKDDKQLQKELEKAKQEFRTREEAGERQHKVEEKEKESQIVNSLGSGCQLSEAETLEGWEHFSQLVSSGATQPSESKALRKGKTLGNKRRR